MEDGTLGVRAPAHAEIREQRRLPVAVLDLLGTVPEPVARAQAAPRRRQRTVAHEATKDDLPLEFGQFARRQLHDAIAGRQLLRFTPALGGSDLVVRRAGELRASVAT